MATRTLAERVAMMPPGLHPLLDQPQLEAYYGVSDWTVDKWIRNGCPVEPIAARGRRFDLQKVKAWMAEHADSTRIPAAA